MEAVPSSGKNSKNSNSEAERARPEAVLANEAVTHRISECVNRAVPRIRCVFPRRLNVSQRVTIRRYSTPANDRNLSTRETPQRSSTTEREETTAVPQAAERGTEAERSCRRLKKTIIKNMMMLMMLLDFGNDDARL